MDKLYSLLLITRRTLEPERAMRLRSLEERALSTRDCYSFREQCSWFFGLRRWAKRLERLNISHTGIYISIRHGKFRNLVRRFGSCSLLHVSDDQITSLPTH